jgi:predicted nucleic acid-binding Zn ribbon protein
VPVYTYKCDLCGYFEAKGGFEASYSPCPGCGDPAKREPVSGIPAAVTPTVGYKPSKEIVR